MEYFVDFVLIGDTFGGLGILFGSPVILLGPRSFGAFWKPRGTFKGHGGPFLGLWVLLKGPEIIFVGLVVIFGGPKPAVLLRA